ncbi:MAG: glycosyltransferase family 39 protein [Neisseria sp.]|nr:glycosyltransferase family 39 protein [Neisseria sp.]
MLTYTPPEQRALAPTYEKPWILLLLVFAWLWPGVFSHDLWKPNEPQIHAAVNAFLAGGSAWQEAAGASPLYLWTAAAFKTLLAPHWADAYSAMRFASVLFTVVGLTACGLAGYHLLGRHQGRSVVLILIGCAGLIEAGHFLGGMAVSFAAFGLLLYGFSAARKRLIAAAMSLGVAWVLLAWDLGLLWVVAMVLLAINLLCVSEWNVKRYKLSLLGAAVVALPLLAALALAMAKQAPDAFAHWWQTQSFGVFGGAADFSLGFELGFYLKNVLWFAFPAWPLAIWTARKVRLWQSDWGKLALLWLAIAGVVLAFEPNASRHHLMAIMPPLALLAAAKLDSLRRGPAAFFNWFGGMTFGLIALLLWLAFAVIHTGYPASLASKAMTLNPYFVADIDAMPMLVAASFTPLWIWALTRKHIKGRQAVTNWAAGMTLAWALLMTLLLPWIDTMRSYRFIAEQVQTAWQAQNDDSCVYTHSELAKLAWQEYARAPLGNETCGYEIRQMNAQQWQALPKEQVLWAGTRWTMSEEYFVLIKK